MEFDDAVGAARAHGMNVIAAAGNTFGAPVVTPGNLPMILSVGAVDSSSGAGCAISATGADIAAPGCGVDGALPASGVPISTQQGTSIAAAIVAAGLAAIRTWRPDLTPGESEQLLQGTASAGRLDLSAAFVAAGYALPTDPPSSPAVPSVPQPRAARPRVRRAPHQLPPTSVAYRNPASVSRCVARHDDQTHRDHPEPARQCSGDAPGLRARQARQAPTRGNANPQVVQDRSAGSRVATGVGCVHRSKGRDARQCHGNGDPMRRLACLAVVFAALAVVPDTHAGSYAVQSCTQAFGASAFAFTSDAPATLGPTVQCPGNVSARSGGITARAVPGAGQPLHTRRRPSP